MVMPEEWREPNTIILNNLSHYTLYALDELEKLSESENRFFLNNLMYLGNQSASIFATMRLGTAYDFSVWDDWKNGLISDNIYSTHQKPDANQIYLVGRRLFEEIGYDLGDHEKEAPLKLKKFEMILKHLSCGLESVKSLRYNEDYQKMKLVLSNLEKETSF